MHVAIGSLVKQGIDQAAKIYAIFRIPLVKKNGPG